MVEWVLHPNGFDFEARAFLHFLLYYVFDDFSKFRCTFGTLHFEKSSNTAKSLGKIKKNLSIILLLKCPLLESKMFTVCNGIYCNAAWAITGHLKTFSPSISTFFSIVPLKKL